MTITEEKGLTVALAEVFSICPVKKIIVFRKKNFSCPP